MYEPGETGAETRNFFGEILEFLIPFFTGFGLLYKIHKTLMPIHFRRNIPICINEDKHFRAKDFFITVQKQTFSGRAVQIRNNSSENASFSK